MNRRLRRNPPKHTLALRPGRSILPIALPTELNTAVVAGAPAPAAPEIAVNVEPQGVGDATVIDRDEGSPPCKLGPVVDDVIN